MNKLTYFRDRLIKILNNSKKRWNSLTMNQKFAVGLGSVIVILVVIIAGINLTSQSVLSGPASLEVMNSSTNDPVAEAVVSVGGQSGVTGKDGKVTFNKIKNGLYEVNIFQKNYKPLTKEIKVSDSTRAGIVVFISPSNRASITGSLQTANGLTLLNSISLKAGERSASIDEEGNFEIRDVPVELRQFTIESPDYIDQKIPLQLASGDNKLDTIILTPAYDYTIKTIDFLTNTPVHNAVSILNEVQYLSSPEGMLVIKDIGIQESPSVAVTKDGYVTQTLMVTGKKSNPANTTKTSSSKDTNLDEIQEVRLTPAGKILYTSERDGLSSIYIANYDGTEETKINALGPTTKSAATGPEFSGKSILFNSIIATTNGPQVYEVTVPGNQPQLINIQLPSASSPTVTVQDFYFLQSQKKLRYTRDIGKDDTIKTTKLTLELSNLDGSLPIKVFETMFDTATRVDELRSFEVSPSGKHVTYILSESNKIPFKHLKSTVSDFDTLALITKTLQVVTSESTALTVVGVSSNNEYVMLSDDLSSGGKKVTVVNTSSNMSVDYMTLNLFEDFAQISSDNKFVYFISVRDGKSDIYRLEFQTGDISKITTTGNIGSFYLDTNNVLQYQIEQGMYLLDMRQKPPLNPIMTNISTNFKMWNPFPIGI